MPCTVPEGGGSRHGGGWRLLRGHVRRPACVVLDEPLLRSGALPVLFSLFLRQMQSKPKSYHLPKHWIKSIHNYSLITDHILVCKVRLVSIIQNRHRSIQSTLLHGNDSYGRRRTFSTPHPISGRRLGWCWISQWPNRFMTGRKSLGRRGWEWSEEMSNRLCISKRR